MSGLEIFGAIAGALQVADQCQRVLSRIRAKRRDEPALRELRAFVAQTIDEIDKCMANLSPGAQGAAKRLRDRLIIITQNIDQVVGLSWWEKFANLLRIWNKEYIEDFERVLKEFRDTLVLEANVLLESIKRQQENLEFCLREKVDEVIQRVDGVDDRVINLLQTKLADLKLEDKVVCLQSIADDIIQRLDLLHATEAATSRSLDAVSTAVVRVEERS